MGKGLWCEQETSIKLPFLSDFTATASFTTEAQLLVDLFLTQSQS